MTSSAVGPESPKGRYLMTLSLTALGVVFGDIGTSPIYAIRESFHSGHGLDPTPANVLGILSLILWSLIIVISIKYLIFVMRADNHGEGGIIALRRKPRPKSASSWSWPVSSGRLSSTVTASSLRRFPC